MGESARRRGRGAASPAADARDASQDAQAPLHLPLVDEAREAVHQEPKPTWRGWIHAITTPVALVAGVVLIAVAHGAEARWASTVFVLASLLLFGNSALYHRIDWSPRTKLTLKRIDHSNIFVLIAGTYTPLALLALPPAQGVPLLVAVWTGALLGVLFRVLWIGAPRWLYVLLYLALGWVAVLYFPALFHADPAMMVLVAVGGLLYTVGAVVYGLKRPNPVPGRFGFHEVFHACTALAFVCHWTATLLIALHPAA